MNKEVNDALHTLLNISLKDKSFSTQKQQFKIVYNYITNLQEENNNLKEDFKRHIDRINELTERSDNLQEENERLKELCDKYEEEHNTTFQEWLKELKENNNV